MKRLFCFCIVTFLGMTCKALEPNALTNIALLVKMRGLESEHASSEIMASIAETNGLSPKDCADALHLVYALFRNSTNSFDVGCSQHAVSLLGEFGGTNAIPYLLSIMENDEGLFRFYAGQGYLHVVHASPDSMSPVKETIARSTRQGETFAREIYRQADFDLTYDAPPPDYHRNLLRFLLEQSTVERNERRMLDEILCREIPKWRASTQRAENAAKMMRNHPDDAELVAFFQMVRTNAIESAKMTLSAKRTPADSPSSADSLSQTAAPSAETDPWAGLLDDLPEKKPWIPPPDAEPPL